MSKSAVIRPIQLSEIEIFMDEVERNVLESGRDGTPIFNAYNEKTPFNRANKSKSFLENMSKKTTEPGWQRAWGIFTDDGVIHGDIGLWVDQNHASLHRAMFGMCMDKDYRGQGWGSKLMKTAIEYAKGLKLEYIDLYVLEGNEPAIALYKKFGFTETGYWPDRWRLLGKKVGEYSYVLNLGKSE